MMHCKNMQNDPLAMKCVSLQNSYSNLLLTRFSPWRGVSGPSR